MRPFGGGGTAGRDWERVVVAAPLIACASISEACRRDRRFPPPGQASWSWFGHDAFGTP